MKRNSPERDLQVALVKHLWKRCVPGVAWWHTPNGGYRDIREAANLKRMGQRPGVSDLVFIRRDMPPLALELKSEDGRFTPSQLEFGRLWESAGGYFFGANNLDSALTILTTAEIIR